MRFATSLLFILPAIAQTTVIDGGTLIDGNGGPPVSDSVVVITGQRIAAAGPRASVRVPSGATIIDAKGRYIVPGFIDTNVHLSLYGGARERYESLVRYQPRQNEIVLEAAQIDLSHGITTVRDSYGMLLPLTHVRDEIAHGNAVGSRIQAAGNIVGWGGPYSISFSLTPDKDLTLFQEQMNDYVTQGAGEELNDMTPDELRVAINKYLDKGPDFIKYGGTSHFSQPTYIGFSPEAQKIMVDEAHKRGRGAETHSTTIEGLRLSILAGIDLIQHPELLTPKSMPDDLVELIKSHNVIGSMLVSTMTGEAWTKHLKAKEEAQKKYAKPANHPLTVAKGWPAAQENKLRIGVGFKVSRSMPLRIVQSKQNPRLKQLRRALAQPLRETGRQGRGLAGIEGPNLLEEAVRAGLRIECVFVAQGFEHLLEGLGLSREIDVLLLPKDLLDSVLTTETPQPIAALVEPPDWTWAHFLDVHRKATPLVVVLAGLQDPGNLGTILRSAEAFGADGVISLPGTVSAWNPKAVRASAGSVFRLPLVTASVDECFMRLREVGVKVWTTTVHAAEPADLVEPGRAGGAADRQRGQRCARRIWRQRPTAR